MTVLFLPYRYTTVLFSSTWRCVMQKLVMGLMRNGFSGADGLPNGKKGIAGDDGEEQG